MKRILLVEDTSLLAENISDILRNTGFEVAIAVNGKVALDMLGSVHPDLIITDVLMPEMDGIEFVKAIRQWSAYSSLPIIILSSRATAGDIELGKRAGANEYLTKPCAAEELIETVTKILGL
jgi:CheY-like chemotaxis protein